MVSEAEKFRQEDDANAKRVESKNGFENFVYTVKKTAGEESTKAKLTADEISKVEELCSDALSWLESNMQSSSEEIDSRRSSFEKDIQPYMMKFYGNTGNSDDDNGHSEPHVDEVD
jgi:L1 cell adhesion molecule like protein